MKRLPFFVGFCALAATLAVGSGYTQDKKEDKKGDQPTTKGTLPSGWGKLGLTPDQKKKITGIRGTYHAKIEDLKKQIEMLKEEDIAECVKVLTDDQKNLLKKINNEKVDGKDDKKGDKKGDEKKSDDKKGEVLQALPAVRTRDD